MLNKEAIKDIALKVGFDLCGVTTCHPLTENARHFEEWLSRGYQSTLGYMERNREKRFDPRLLVEGAQTVVVCAISYKNHISEGYPPHHRTKIASYACNRDYHTTLKEMLFALLAALKERHPQLSGRAFVDSAPLCEKQLAVDAGLGWIGRQSLLVTPQYGTFVVLGELLLDQACDTYDTPFEGSRCGRCHNCMESCPTGAIVAPKVIDTRRCISRHTIEKDPEEGIDLHGWIFGCDACQSCCPYNHKAPLHRHPAFDPLFDPITMDATTWGSMSEEEFRLKMGTSPLTRSGLERICRNIRPLSPKEDE